MTAYVPVPKPVVEALLETDDPLGYPGDDPAIRNDLKVALGRAVTPPWHLTTRAVTELRRIIGEKGPVAISDLDQLRGTIRDELDKLEVSLYDEVAVYHGLVWTGLVVELARYGTQNGVIDDRTYRTVAEIAATVGAALLDYVPDGADRG